MALKNARIVDVARAAGVSTATVSRALSSPDLLTEETRKAVFAAIKATGYRVNKTARKLRTRQAGAVLVLVPNLGNPFFSQILAGISETLGERDTSVLIADTEDRATSGQHLVDYFLDAQIDGMICLDGALSQRELAQFEENGVSGKIVFACEWVQGSDFPSVRSDNIQGARLAVGHLYDLGHRKIAHVTGPQDNVLTHARREGMLAERARLGLPAREEWIIRGDFSLESGKAAAHKIVHMTDRPTAVFCASDQVAFGLISTLSAHGLRVPGDISVIGFDDIELSEYYVPALTTIRQDRRALGTKAAQLFHQRVGTGAVAGLGTDEEAPAPVIIGVDLVVRQSAAPVRVEL
ncbi:LacI family DNA-binding transcriptional regulator [Roseibium aggregatum]|uniref:LacI family DNA-binding transcriptional regulator n=1 Tax=Roseibium aggregatum TaxID=187304 RepID=A0A939EHM3_9HYPH|nr:substrate-binding domain-containing protein [Roseibium aggregatum]MBN9672622.1 LacI family DNA-binding transcriptional regulator [Roseibium aggregatum]